MTRAEPSRQRAIGIAGEHISAGEALERLLDADRQHSAEEDCRQGYSATSHSQFYNMRQPAAPPA